VFLFLLMICIITYTNKISGSWPWHLAHQPNKHISLLAYNHLAHQPISKITIQKGLGLGVLQSPPLIFALSSVQLIYKTTARFPKSSKRCGYSARIASSCFHVASSGPYQVHWTFTSPIAQFRSYLLFQSSICTECTYKTPSCST
jgi:hypothetical protein